MEDDIQIGDRVQVYLNAKNWGQDDWFSGMVVRIDPYSQHRGFYWVELDEEARTALGTNMKLISIFNPKNIRKS